MGRIRNDQEYEAKRKEIIDQTIALIMTDGFNKFSLNKLLKKIEMPKGTFFHYYKSKQDLLDMVITESSKEIAENINDIADCENISAKEKIITLFKSSAEQSFNTSEGKEHAQQILTSENKVFFELVKDSLIDVFKDCLTKIIVVGNSNNEFEIKKVTGTVNQILNLTLGTNKIIGDLMLSNDVTSKHNEINETIEVFEDLLALILGLEDSGNLYLRVEE